MATGFIARYSKCLLFAFCTLPAAAADIALVGVIGDKAAVVAIDGGPPKTIKVGQSFGGVSVVAVEKTPERAIVEVQGKRRTLVRGQTYSNSGGGSERQSVTLAAGAGGHFAAEGAVNGAPVRFVVDTGATMVTLPGSDAARLGIDFRKGQAGTAQTANGPATAYRVKLDSVRVGGIELNNVDGVVIEKGLDVALLGMSFLNRVETRQEAGRMTMTRRY